MEEVFIAYFDLLGFKEFILNNTEEQMFQTMDNLYRDIGIALSDGRFTEPKDGIIYPDISNTKINSLNISDTIIFYTNGTGDEDLIDLLKVARYFNFFLNLYMFPVRGSVIKGSIKVVNSNSTNYAGSSYNISCMFGKGIVEAHLKAEGQNWAGTVIDNSALVNSMGNQKVLDFLKEDAIKYSVPYKSGKSGQQEFVLRLIKGIKDDENLDKTSKLIIRVFEKHNKPIDNPSVQTKISNTLEFLRFLKDK